MLERLVLIPFGSTLADIHPIAGAQRSKSPTLSTSINESTTVWHSCNRTSMPSALSMVSTRDDQVVMDHSS